MLRLVVEDRVSPKGPGRRSARGEPFKRAETELATLAKALSSPVRVRIVRLLVARGGLSCGEIAAAFPLTQSTVSEHLRVLRESGLINIDADGLRSMYTVDVRVLRLLQVRVVEL
jgi:ArsR family transcriptional regulator